MYGQTLQGPIQLFKALASKIFLMENALYCLRNMAGDVARGYPLRYALGQLTEASFVRSATTLYCNVQIETQNPRWTLRPSSRRCLRHARPYPSR